MSEFTNFDEEKLDRVLQHFRREHGWDVEELRIHEEDRKRRSSAMFQPYKLPCLRCQKKFMYHTLGTKGRASLLCSDQCASSYGKKEEEEEDWEECTWFK